MTQHYLCPTLSFTLCNKLPGKVLVLLTVTPSLHVGYCRSLVWGSCYPLGTQHNNPIHPEFTEHLLKLVDLIQLRKFRHSPQSCVTDYFSCSLKLRVLVRSFLFKQITVFRLQAARVDKPTERGYWEAEKTSSQEETSILQQLPSTNHKLGAKATQNQGSEWSRKWSLSKTQPTSAVSPGHVLVIDISAAIPQTNATTWGSVLS